MKQKIAIIGGGIGGLTAGFLLQDQAEIRLFEKENRIGGNAYTLHTKRGYDVDIAVAAFGKAGYKNFYMLLDKLGITTSMAPASYFSIHNIDTKKGLYLTPFSFTGLAVQSFSMFSPTHLSSAIGAFWGVKKGVQLLDEGKLEGLSLREALKQIPQLKGEALLLFMCTLCLLSSMHYEEVMESPASFFFYKLKVHDDVISPKAIWSVRCVRNKTRSYVDALATHFREKIVLNSRIKTVLRDDAGVTLVMEDDSRQRFDKLILACNADQALAILDSPTPEEARLLGPWKYKDGTVTVHTDGSAFPRRELCQAYTFLYTQQNSKVHMSVNGSLWHESNVPQDCPYFSSQHPNFPIREDLIEHTTVLRTPVFDHASVATIPKLPSLNGTCHTYYCGSHFGVGLHDDAVTSAIRAAQLLGVQWQ